MKKGKPCPYCGQKMFHGQDFYSTQSKLEAIKQGYEYIDEKGHKIINQAEFRYFHPHDVTLDRSNAGYTANLQ
jgi:hypothetical protein